MSAYLDRPARSLAQYRDDLLRRFAALPLDDIRRARLARRIVAADDELDRRARAAA